MSDKNLTIIEKASLKVADNLEKLKSESEQALLDNPFIEVVDNKTYEQAKKHRTALVTVRTNLEKGDKAIGSLFRNERKKLGDLVVNEIIPITIEREHQLQETIKAYEEKKEAEKQEKLQAAQRREDGFF